MSSLKPNHRKARTSNLVQALFRHERIKTTFSRAKEVQPVAEKIITLGKRADLHARRQAQAVVKDKTILKKLFTDIAPRYKERKGGYTRVIRISPPRKGDSAPLAFLELVK
jgi:large subunit ribosomal protein L17